MRPGIVAIALSLLACGPRPPATTSPSSAVEERDDEASPVPDGTREGDDPGFAAATAPLSNVAANDATGARRLLDEATRQLRAMQTTAYRHRTVVDEEAGRFEYDCSGFVAYALARVAPEALAAIPPSSKARPRAEDFARAFAELPTGADGPPTPWRRIARMSEVAPGDVIAWPRPPEVDSTNTGHIVIVLEVLGAAKRSKAVSSIGGAREILVRVIDSTASPHADDVRGEATTTGLGTGTIGIVVDEGGAPIGYRWRGGRSKQAYLARVSIARPS
jgi:hypothetical protein